VSTIVQARHAIEDIQLEIPFRTGFYREDLGLLSGTSEREAKLKWAFSLP